ncbi:MAG: hypothetical protein R3202_10520 [Candidatus Competibacterales bacterium]|nr:hypothetical protein [Candidatus Competibacterales bacterium]
MSETERRRLAETVRAVCARAAQEAFERAALSGLCLDGVQECTIGAVQAVDIEILIRESPGAAAPQD